MTPDAFRQLALARPNAVESAHLGVIDFRVGGKIFATLGGAAGRPVVKLTPEEQDLLAAAAPGVFAPVEGRWGRFGWTHLDLSVLDQTMAEDALDRSWRNVTVRRTAKRRV